MVTTIVESEAPRLIFGRFRFWLFMVGLVVILTGVLFGYDQVVISGRGDGEMSGDFAGRAVLQAVR